MPVSGGGGPGDVPGARRVEGGTAGGASLPGRRAGVAAADGEAAERAAVREDGSAEGAGGGGPLPDDAAEPRGVRAGGPGGGGGVLSIETVGSGQWLVVSENPRRKVLRPPGRTQDDRSRPTTETQSALDTTSSLSTPALLKPLFLSFFFSLAFPF